MNERTTVPLRTARPRSELMPASMPPPLPRAGATRAPHVRSQLLRSLGVNEQQVQLVKHDLARVRRSLAGIVAAVESVRGALDRLALDVEAGGLTELLARQQ